MIHTWARQGAWQILILQLLAGSSMVFAYAPFGEWYLVFPALVFSSYFLNDLKAKIALKHGFAFALGYFGAGMSWVHISMYQFGGTGAFLATLFTLGFVALLAVFPAIAYYLTRRYFNQFSAGLFWLIAWPFSWFLLEWIRSWIFTGLPWLNLGHSQFEGPLSGIMPILGADGATVWVLLLVGLIQLTIQYRDRLASRLAIAWVINTVLILGLFNLSWVKPSGESLSVTVVQPNVPQENKWVPAYRIKAMEDLYSITEGDKNDLIIWPEAAIPALPSQIMDYLESIDALAEMQEQTILSGIPVQTDGRYYNAIQLYGTSSGEYHKRKLVPFGEYVPFEEQLRGLITFFDMPMSSFSKGDYNQPHLTIDGHQVALAICYEIIFSEMVAQQVEGSDYLVTLSNDAWFGDSHGPQQHLEIARIRALEYGIPIIRGTNDGISAFIDAEGNLIKTLGKGIAGTMQHDLQLQTGMTPYRQIGPTWALVILFIPFVIGLVLNRKAIRRMLRSNDTGSKE